MNRAELHNTPGFHPASLLAAAMYQRHNMPRKRPVATDATSLIRNEGWMNGYLDALDDLVAAASPQPEKTEKAPFQPYSQPAERENPNQK